MKNKIHLVCSIFLLALSSQSLTAQESKEISLMVNPQEDKYLYQPGEPAILDITVLNPGHKTDRTELTYRWSLDGIQTLKEGSLLLDKNKGSISSTLDEPGFLRCDISCVIGDDTLKASCAFGFSVEEISARGQLPENFDRFWREAKAELLRIPLDPQLEKVAVVDSGDAERYKVSLANVNGSRVYGWLHLPKGKGPFPTVLSIPGSGIGRTGRYAGFTKAGIAVFAIEIHGLEPLNHEIIGAVQWMRPADEEIDYFVELQSGVLNGYHDFGKEDPYRYYHRRSLQSAMRALDYLYTREDVDADNVFVFGGSQGGGLSLMLAAIDQGVDGVIATVPAFCNNATKEDQSRPEFVRTMSYFDAALASALIEVPALIGVGFIDATCRPTGIYAAYNNLSGPKSIENFVTLGHGSPADWRSQTIAWILENIKSKEILFSEHFDDDALSSRGWYDESRVRMVGDARAGEACIEYEWDSELNSSGSASIRHLFEAGEEVYIRFYLKLSEGWGWTGRNYHPHLTYFMTTENSEYHGPAASHLTLYVEPVNGKLRLAATDIQNKDTPHGLTQGELKGGYNGMLYDSEKVLFKDDQWHCIEACFKLNTLDMENDRPNPDGIVRGWFDDELVVEHNNVILRSTDFPDMKINQFLMAPYFGPGLLPHAQKLWIDELAVGKKRIGPLP